MTQLLLLLLLLAATASKVGCEKHSTQTVTEFHDAKASASAVDREEGLSSAMANPSGTEETVSSVTSEYKQTSTSVRLLDDSNREIRRRGGAALWPLPNPTAEPTESSSEPQDTSSVDAIMVVVPVLLVLLIILVLAIAVVSVRRKRKTSGFHDAKEDETLEGENTEKVPMPMFEDDVPSVLELEMEDLEKWIAKDPEGNGQDSVKENSM